jgi:hypothetical protein
MGIETYIAGSPEDVGRAADWLLRAREIMLSDTATLDSMGAQSGQVWSGKGAAAYESFCYELSDAAEQLTNLCHLAEEKVRAFAQQLQFRQEDMEEHRGAAAKGGLYSCGTEIVGPPESPVPRLRPADPTPEQRAKFNKEDAEDLAAKNRCDLYSQIAAKVQATYNELDEWVANNLVPMETECNTKFDFDTIAAALPGFAESVTETAFEVRAKNARAAAARSAEILAEFRAENAAHGGQPTPRERALANAMRAQNSSLNKFADQIGDWAKNLGRAATAVDIATTINDLAHGASPSSTASDLIGAAGAAALAGAIVSTAPAWGTGLIVAGAAVGGGMCAKWVYETTVPQVTRERFDEGVKDTWNSWAEAGSQVWKAQVNAYR